MKILNRLNKLKKPRSKNKNIFNSLKINNSSKHLIGIDNKGLIVVLINSIKPKGNGEYLSNIIIKHGVNCSVHLKNEKLTKKFTMIKCLSNDNSTKELFLMSLERILENIPNEVSEIKIDELTKKLVKLFEKLSNKINIDLTGFWGELFIIDYLKSTELLVEAWHPETNDLFDFFLKNLALEVKTTTKNDRKHIFKFEQLNSKSNKIIIGSIMLKRSRAGKSLLDLKKKILKKISKTELIEKVNEIYAIMVANKSQKDLDSEKYSYEYAKENISFFDSVKIPRIKETPMYGIKNIKFESDLNISKSINNFSEYPFLK